MKSNWKGDSSLYWKYESGDDYISAVAVTCCNEADGFNNRYLVESGALIIDERTFRYVLESVCYNGAQVVPSLPDIAYALQGYCGIERDSHGEQYVQLGYTPQGDGESGLGGGFEPDYVLHGNTNLERFIQSEFLH